MSAVTECKTKSPQEELLWTAVVTIAGYFYKVDFSNRDEIRDSLQKKSNMCAKKNAVPAIEE